MPQLTSTQHNDLEKDSFSKSKSDYHTSLLNLSEVFHLTQSESELFAMICKAYNRLTVE
jgi:hypothetical protein